MNKTMMMLTAPMLFAFLITAVFGLPESAGAHATNLEQQSHGRELYNLDQPEPEQNARNFREGQQARPIF